MTAEPVKCQCGKVIPNSTFAVTRSCDPMHIPVCSLRCAEKEARRYTHARIWWGTSLSPETTTHNYKQWAASKA
jgi:hypothetical protein